MRKIISLLIVLTLLMLSGCKNTPDTSWVPEGEETERFVYSSRMYGQLIRYDIIDRKATIACPDPMCKHGSDCLVTNIFASYVGDGYILYVRMQNGLLSGMSMYSLNLNNGSITKIVDCPRFQRVTFINDFAVFTGSRVIYNDDGSVKGQVWDVYKYYMDRNELIKINKESLNGELVAESYTDDSILWSDYQKCSGYSCFETDYDFNNMTPADFYVRLGQFEYEFDDNYGDDGTLTFTISRKNVNGGIAERVVTNATSYRLDNNNEPKGIVYNSFIEDSGKNVIRYVDLTDLSSRKLADIPQGYTFTDELVFPSIGSSLYAQGYVGIYLTYSDPELSDAHNDNTIFFVNIETGDNFIISP